MVVESRLYFFRFVRVLAAPGTRTNALCNRIRVWSGAAPSRQAYQTGGFLPHWVRLCGQLYYWDGNGLYAARDACQRALKGLHNTPRGTPFLAEEAPHENRS